MSSCFSIMATMNEPGSVGSLYPLTYLVVKERQTEILFSPKRHRKLIADSSNEIKFQINFFVRMIRNLYSFALYL